MANAFDHVCPKCGDADHIDVAATVWVRLTENGSDLDLSAQGDTEFTPRSLAVCQTCDFSGRLAEFDALEGEEGGAA